MSTVTKSLRSAPAIPESVAPESVAPESVAPESVAPESVTPENVTTPESIAKSVTSTVHARSKQWVSLLTEFAPGIDRKNGDQVLAAKLVHAAIMDGRADGYVFKGSTPLDAKAVKQGRADFSKLHKEHCAIRFLWQSLGLHSQIVKNLEQL